MPKGAERKMACISGYSSAVRGTPVPFISTSSRPRKRKEVPIVMTSEGMLSQETSAPLIQPQSAPTAKAATRPRYQGTPIGTRSAKAAVPRAMIEGKERSISPVMTTKVSAMAMMPNCGVVWAKAR